MQRGVAGNRLMLAMGLAGFLLLGGLLLWAAGFALADGTDCPGNRPGDQFFGLDTNRSLWPPGANCSDGSVAQAFDGLTTILVLLIGVGVAVLIAGAAAAARYSLLRGDAA